MKACSDTSLPRTSLLLRALPFWMSLGFLPIIAAAIYWGGVMLLIIPVCTSALFSILDGIGGVSRENLDPETDEQDLFWYRAITLIWAPIQLALIFGALAAVPALDLPLFSHALPVFIAVGFVTGSIGITYAHELIHQKTRLEQCLGEVLLISVLYGHFKTEHLLVHHRYVGTPRDPVSARKGEGFYRFFPRAVIGQVISATRAEAAMLTRKGLSPFHPKNRFWRYVSGALACLFIAFLIAGWVGVGLFVVQALFAIASLELVNYIEHYGLTRKHLGAGKYEHVLPRHSWNAAHKFTNFLLINLQRHSDHHYKPSRRFPLLQTYSQNDAPQLPFSYPLMIVCALVPALWKRMMDPRVEDWREKHYPEILDWRPYSEGTTPLPR